FGRTVNTMKGLTSLLLTALMLQAGCAEEVEPGIVEFEWRLGSQGCDHYGVTEVSAHLFGFQSAEPVETRTFACQDGTGRLEGVDPGEYTLRLDGMDSDGCTTHRTRTEIIVPSGSLVTLERPLSLTRHRRPLEIMWNFENQLDCLGNQVAQVEIRVEVGDEEGFTEVRLCEGFTTTVPGDIAPGDLTITIFGVDESGERVFRGTVTRSPDFFGEDLCAPTLKVLAVLSECLDSNCEEE
ncbi:MAG: hypothetical protein ACPGQS_07285, partial [Bradymonadia bacterium]